MLNEELAWMVDRDLRARGIVDERLLTAFESVDRARFVGPVEKDRAYTDRALQISHGQTISQPYMVALMLDALKLTGQEKVLEIGTGSGYQTALLAECAGEVWSVERIEYLATQAEDLLLELGYTNVRYFLGDGTLGWPEGAPYDRIVVSAASPQVPPALIEQLAEGGTLVVPVGPADQQELIIAQKKNGRLEETTGTACTFVPLIGQQGFPERR